MRIGVFGDSFASEKMQCHKTYPNFSVPGTAWCNLLKTDFEIENFAEAGSDLFYSFNLWRKNKHKFDKTIFVITGPFRLQVKANDNVYRFNHLPDLDMLEDKNVKNAVLSYYRYILDDEKEIYFHGHMSNVVQKDEDTISIDVFGDYGLHHVFDMENVVWKTKARQSRRDNYVDFRYCHMTKENNEVLARQVFDCIKNNTNYEFDINRFKVPEPEDKTKYILKRDSNGLT